MNELIISEGCFGPGVSVDKVSLFLGELDDNNGPSLPDRAKRVLEVLDAQEALIDQLLELQTKLDMQDWATIAQIVANRGQFNYDDEHSDEGSSCDQCGNYNTYSIFTKEKIETKFKGLIKEDKDLGENIEGYSINNIFVHDNSVAFAKENVGKEVEYELNYDGYRPYGAFKKDFYKKAIIITK